MSEEKPDLTPALERTEYPPLLNVAVPVIMLVVSIAYAWSLRDVTNPAMNLLMLKPLFVVIWGLLLIVIVKDVVPSIRLHQEWAKARLASRKPLRERFAPGTEAGAGLVVAATFAFAFFGPGDGPIVYLLSAFTYLVVAGYLIGDRNPFWLVAQAATFAAGLYFIMGVVLRVPL